LALDLDACRLAFLVQDHREKPRDEAQAVAAQEIPPRPRVEGQVTRGSELGRVEPKLLHLREHALGRHPVAPYGELAHAPRDRRPGYLHPNSSTRTGRCSRSEQSAARATTSASRASPTGHGLSPPSCTAKRKPCSSAR